MLGAGVIGRDRQGHIIAVTDWDKSRFLPFGWNFTRIDYFVTEIIHGRDGEYYLESWKNRKELESVFWEVLWKNLPDEMRAEKEKIEEAIKISKGIGALWDFMEKHEGVDSFDEDHHSAFPVIRGYL